VQPRCTAVPLTTVTAAARTEDRFRPFPVAARRDAPAVHRGSGALDPRAFPRTFTFGPVRQLDAVASRLLINLTARAPLLPGAAELAYLDIDDTLKRTYGYAKQGAGRGYTGVKGLNALLAIVRTPSSAPVIAAARLYKGSTNSTRGADRFAVMICAPAATARA